MTRPKSKRGRPIAREWVTIAPAAIALNLTPYALAQLRPQLKAGLHYRCTNPQAATAKGKRYLYHPDRIAAWFAAQD
jgi:hypothetical protein